MLSRAGTQRNWMNQPQHQFQGRPSIRPGPLIATRVFIDWSQFANAVQSNNPLCAQKSHRFGCDQDERRSIIPMTSRIYWESVPRCFAITCDRLPTGYAIALEQWN